MDLNPGVKVLQGFYSMNSICWNKWQGWYINNLAMSTKTRNEFGVLKSVLNDWVSYSLAVVLIESRPWATEHDI